MTASEEPFPRSSDQPAAPQVMAQRTALIYSRGTVLAATAMVAGLLWPALAAYAVWTLAAVPVAAALVSAGNAWRTDRQLAAAALLAVLGLAAVWVGRNRL